MQVPYIGVTGFMSRDEVLAALEAIDHLPNWSDRKLMVGVLASSKTLAGQSNKWPNRYPKVDDIAELFPADRRTVNLIHYATDDCHTLGDQLEALVRLGGKYLDGFQLNVRWPDPSTIIVVPPYMRVVLQINPRALADADNNPATVAKFLTDYNGVISDVLIDASGGRGTLMDPIAARGYLEAIVAAHPKLGIGVAGGLSAQTVGQLQKLVDLFPKLSVDAEGRLRTTDDHLDLQAMKTYISVADGLFD